jgi:hypothetical protein
MLLPAPSAALVDAMSDSTGPVPSAGCYGIDPPVRNATRLPSGDQKGELLRQVVVNRVNAQL